MWIAVAEYADGMTVEGKFTYREGGSYIAECERQQELEAWLIEQHEDCIYYSVTYTGEE